MMGLATAALGAGGGDTMMGLATAVLGAGGGDTMMGLAAAALGAGGGDTMMGLATAALGAGGDDTMMGLVTATGAGGGDTMIGLAKAAGVGGGDTMMGLAINRPAPERRTTPRMGRLDFNALGFIEGVLPWKELCTRRVTHKLYESYNKSNFFPQIYENWGVSIFNKAKI
jgi:hypothetical protein